MEYDLQFNFICHFIFEKGKMLSYSSDILYISYTAHFCLSNKVKLLYTFFPFRCFTVDLIFSLLFFHTHIILNCSKVFEYFYLFIHSIDFTLSLSYVFIHTYFSVTVLFLIFRAIFFSFFSRRLSFKYMSNYFWKLCE